ncbi:hypothetical protein M408DRAFT_326875 [Serendipita vermifera MAFF 305830]|uniref:Tyrosine specific protein phosphatases domain-containing protein n=1 Tax=Serendipita vermifera MAFF 305830 TaxID=933852 RepID=A0A0C3BLA9_SERVB|nr:hypothetical protein M408DRAFT_326875 [Serendipita vermifera MAFF 305830]
MTEIYIKRVEAELSNREAARVESHQAEPKEPAYAPHYRTSVAQVPANVRCNRYMDVVPYDRSRVILPTGTYINASWVKELAGGKWTIATQAPLERTAHSFLSMFLLPIAPPGSNSSPPPEANRLRTIVQLTPNMEGRLAKAFPYFPKTVGEEMKWPPPKHDHTPPIKVRLLEVSSPEEEGEQPSWKHSVLAVSYEGKEDSPHLVRHLHFLGWPDHGVPQDIRSLLQFMQFVEACNTDGTHTDAAINPDPPIVIGCSAGVGRTGTYIALASLLRAHGLNRPDTISVVDISNRKADWNGTSPISSPLGPLSEEIKEDKIAQEVDALREQRPMMVQSHAQLRFIYSVFLATLKLENGS